MEFSNRKPPSESTSQPAIVRARPGSDSVAEMAGHLLTEHTSALFENTDRATNNLSPAKVLSFMQQGGLEQIRIADRPEAHSGSPTAEVVAWNIEGLTAEVFAWNIECLVSRGERAYAVLEGLLNDCDHGTALHVIDGLARHGITARDFLVEVGLKASGDTNVYLAAGHLCALGCEHDASIVLNDYFTRGLIDEAVVPPMLELLNRMEREQLVYVQSGLATLEKLAPQASQPLIREMLQDVERITRKYDSFSVRDTRLPERHDPQG